MGNFERKYAPIELWSYFIDILAFERGKLCPGVGILFRFFSDPGAGVLHWKAVPGAGILTEKLVARQSARGGGMVTGQIVTCIRAMKVNELRQIEDVNYKQISTVFRSVQCSAVQF